ncbi:MAG: hypothetical protein Q8Q42_03530 [Nanoarchaeota archaeon]|nr:hypothetical protein [Nanoarchaeota archaeon]
MTEEKAIAVEKESPKEVVNTQEIRKEVEILKSKLNEANAKKEEWFNKKEDLNKQIAELIKSLKLLNPEIEVEKKKEQELRLQRQTSNRKFSEYLVKSKDLVKGRNALTEKYGRDSTPEKIKTNIEKLEYSIETQALSMNQEKKIMTQIKELKKILSETGFVGDFKGQMKEISEKLTEAKEVADKSHKELNELLKNNRKKFKDYIANSKKVNKLKKDQRNAFKNFIQSKKEFLDLNELLKKKLEILGEKLEKKRVKKKQKKHNKQEVRILQNTLIDNARIIEEKVRDVEKKIKDKKKLTTQDLLAMQGSKDETKE